jgi:hypothetical protein
MSPAPGSPSASLSAHRKRELFNVAEDIASTIQKCGATRCDELRLLEKFIKVLLNVE